MTREQRLKALEKELLGFQVGDRVRVVKSLCVVLSCAGCTLEGTVVERALDKLHLSMGRSLTSCFLFPSDLEHLDD
jgi:hypothetical protein